MKQEQEKQNPSPRQLLAEELERRCRSNPRYSMRAFAKALGLSPSALSMVMAGHRGLSTDLAKRLSHKLGLDPVSAGRFVNGFLRNKTSPTTITNFDTLSLDTFSVISEWYHFGLLSLIEVKDFKPDPQWMASRLGVSIAEVKAAVERLVRLGILDTSKRRWKQIGQPILVENTESTAATKRNQKQVLEMAIHSLENDPVEVRDLTSMTIAINPEWIPLAREEIKKFRIHLMELLEGKGDAREVYHLAVQIYPVTKKQRN